MSYTEQQINLTYSYMPQLRRYLKQVKNKNDLTQKVIFAIREHAYTQY